MSIQISNHEDGVEQQGLGERQLEITIGAELTPPHKVQILWGKDPEDDAPICEYRFASEAELTAFWSGVEAAEGWGDYEVIEQCDAEAEDCSVKQAHD